MADVIFVSVAIAFFGLCVAYVRALDRMSRPGAGPDGPAEAPR
jgi:hypothetical protein